MIVARRTYIVQIYQLGDFPTVIENRTAYALLGFLTWRPMSGYDLKQAIARSVGNFWSESYGQIYPMLRRLAGEGWIARCPDRHPDGDANGRARQVYAITGAGREALRAWLRAPAADRPSRIELLLKLFFGDEVPLPVSRSHVEAARARAVDSLYRYRAIAAELERQRADDPRMPFWRLTLDYGLGSTQARIDWCDRALGELDRLAGIDDSGPEDADTGRSRPEAPQLEEKA